MVNHAAFVWSIAESLRGPFKPSEYGSVVLPFTVLRRLDAVLTDTTAAVLEAAPKMTSMPEQLRSIKLREAAGREFYNTSPFDFAKLVADPQDLRSYVVGKLARDPELARQADANTPQQFAESPALPKAFEKAVVEVREETLAFIDDPFAEGGLFAELGKALPAMLYEHLKQTRGMD